MEVTEMVSRPGRLGVPELAEATDPDDDWTGCTDAATRRKIQNRLNVRAYRRRKAAEARQHQAHEKLAKDPGGREMSAPYWIEDQQRVLVLPIRTAASKKPGAPLLIDKNFTSRPGSSTKALTSVMFPLSSDHLITLLQYNVLRASIANRNLLTECYDTVILPDCSADAGTIRVLPSDAPLHLLPASLQPTALQRAMPHEDWVDIIPHPKWRDNVLCAIGTFDEDDLWTDIIGGLFEGFPHSEVESRGLVAWSPPWEISGWELSPGFMRKWGWTVEGCDDILEATNRWRARRGESPLTWSSRVIDLDEMA